MDNFLVTKIAALFDVTSYSLVEVHRHSGRTYFLPSSGGRVSQARRQHEAGGPHI
jgi:hypothetical protein